MNQNRRFLLKGTLAASAAGVAISAGLLTPRVAMAAWSKSAFEATDVNSALTASMGSSSMTDSSKVMLKAPDIAENGAVVPVTVTSTIPNVQSIGILVSNNAQPLSATFNLGPNTEADISTRIKMGKTSDVIAIVKADGKLYSAKKQVKVTIGGCGG
jgi:sulfur-oxidizing protein SoxY